MENLRWFKKKENLEFSTVGTFNKKTMFSKHVLIEENLCFLINSGNLIWWENIRRSFVNLVRDEIFFCIFMIDKVGEK